MPRVSVPVGSYETNGKRASWESGFSKHTDTSLTGPCPRSSHSLFRRWGEVEGQSIKHINPSWHKGLVVSGFWLLLMGSFIDSVRGPLIPVVSKALSLSYFQTAMWIVVGNLAAIPVLFYCFTWLNRVGEKTVSIGGCFIGVLGSLYIFLVSGQRSLLFSGILMGVCIAVVGALSNVLVLKGTPVRFQSRVLCGLHLMFGLGSMLAPAAVKLSLSWNWNWPWIFSGAWLIGTITILILFFSVPNSKGQVEQAAQSKRLSRIQALILFGFSSYVGAEVITSMWMVTYLVETNHLNVAEASTYVGYFFLTMTISRLLCFLSLPKTWVRTLSWLCLFVGCGFLVLGHSGYLWAFPLVGLVGPYFPLHLGEISQSFPKQWRSIAIWVIICIQIALAICHLGVGNLVEWWGIRATYLAPLVLFCLAMACQAVYFRWERTASDSE